MHAILLHDLALKPRREEGSAPGCGLGCFGMTFLGLLLVGFVIYMFLRGRGDRREQLGASHRPMGSGPAGAPNFASPYPKCPSCGAPGDKMKAAWDGMRKVTWSCGYCAATAGVQELKDEELPASARQRLGLDAPAAMAPGQPGYPPQGGMGGVGGLLTGMMLGSMMGGGHHHDHDRERNGSGDSAGGWGSSGGGSDWGDSSGGGSDWGDSSGGGSDWGDSGGGDGGGDGGGGD
ncbi:MAG: hypothetical protein HY823_01725 [Acidobacteria bacterium]|nr:hypothetical protein [Acidobacteriota bacterium]